jgi:hypothetical protein
MLLLMATMSNEAKILVAGCGESGAKWILNQPNPSDYVGIDRVSYNERVVSQDVLQMSFPARSFEKVIGDFILNSVRFRKKTVSEIKQDPALLDTSDFPPLVRWWYIDTVKRSPNAVRTRYREVTYLLRIAALREMWRVTKHGGTIELLDYTYNIREVLDNPLGMLALKDPQKVRLTLQDIGDADFDRSNSLSKVLRHVRQDRSKVQKLKLIRVSTDPQQMQFAG